MDVTTEAVWIDGRIVEGPEAKVHVMSPSLHYGWGAYEGIRFYTSHDPERPGPLIFRLSEHLRRLRDSSEALGMRLPHSEEELTSACVDLVRRSGLPEGYLRPLVMLRAGAMSVAGQIDDVSVVIGCWTWSGYVGGADTGISVRTSSWVRCGASQIPPSVKSTGGYLNPSLARMEAVRGGDHEAILLNQAGRVAEASAANVFAVIDGTLTTPPLDEGILPGITRDAVLTLAADAGMPTLCRPIEPEELHAAEELMLAGTAMELASVVRLDGKPVGQGRPGPWFTTLRAALDDAFHGRAADHREWSTDCASGTTVQDPLSSAPTASRP